MMSRDQMRSEAAKRHGLNLDENQLNDLYGGKDVNLPSFKMAGFGDTDNVNNVNYSDADGGTIAPSVTSPDTSNVNTGQTYNSKLPNAYSLDTGYKPEEFTVNGLAPGESTSESTVSGLGNWNPWGDRASGLPTDLGFDMETVLPDNLKLPDPTIFPSVGADQGSGGSNPLFNSGQEATLPGPDITLPGPDITDNNPGANLGNPTNDVGNFAFAGGGGGNSAAPFDFSSAMSQWATDNPSFFSPNISVGTPDVNVQGGGVNQYQLEQSLANQANPNASGINSILSNQDQFGQNQSNFMQGVGDGFSYTNDRIDQGFNALDPRLDAMGNNLDGINRNVGSINTNLGNVNTGISGLGDQFSNFGNSFDRFNNQYTANSGAMQQGMSDSLTNQQGISNQLGSLNKDMFGQGGFGGMDQGFTNMGGRFDQIGGQLAGYNNQLFGDPNSQGYGQLGNRGTIGDMGANMGAGFADMGSQLGQGFGGLNNSITGMNDQLFGNSQQMGQFDLMNQGMGNLGNQFNTGLSNMGNRFDTSMMNMGDQFGTGLRGMGNQFGTDMTNMGNRFNTGMMNMGDRFGTDLGNMGNRFGSDLSSLGDTFTDQFGMMVDPLTAGITGLDTQLGGQASYMNAIDAQIRNLQNLIPTLDDIRGIIPNQMDMTDLVSSGNLDDIAKEINSDFATFGNASTMEDANKNVNWQGAADVTQGRGFTDQQIANPELNMPAIQDYTGAMRVPLIENVLNRVGGANPYDTRQNEILTGQERSLDKNYDDAVERIKNQFAVTDDLGSPAYRAAIREVEEGRARDKTAVQSQFQMQAAGLDESMSRGRLQDLSSALGGEQGRVYQEMGMQDQLQRNANNDYLNYMNQLQASYYEPQRQRDEGLRYSLAGLGNSAQPNIGAAIQGYGSAAESQGNLANTLYAQGGGMFNNLMNQPAFR